MAASIVNYLYLGTYDRGVFQTEFVKAFSGSANYRANAIPDMFVLLSLIERDPLIVDIRWAAYMLATVMKETTTRTTVERQTSTPGPGPNSAHQAFDDLFK